MKKSWAKRDPIKNYFPLPNEIYHLGLSHGAIAVYGYLLSIENRSTYQCYPSYATIGHAVGIGDQTFALIARAAAAATIADSLNKCFIIAVNYKDNILLKGL